MKPIENIAEMALESVHLANERYAQGVRDGQEAERRYFTALTLHARAVIAAYNRAEKDEQTKIPTMLHITIEALKLACPELVRAAGRVVPTIPGRPDQDLNTRGTYAVPGR